MEKLQTRLSSLHTMGIHHGGRGKCNPEGVDRGEDSAGPRLEDARQRTKATQTLQVSLCVRQTSDTTWSAQVLLCCLAL